MIILKKKEFWNRRSAYIFKREFERSLNKNNPFWLLTTNYNYCSQFIIPIFSYTNWQLWYQTKLCLCLVFFGDIFTEKNFVQISFYSYFRFKYVVNIIFSLFHVLSYFSADNKLKFIIQLIKKGFKSSSSPEKNILLLLEWLKTKGHSHWTLRQQNI